MSGVSRQHPIPAVLWQPAKGKTCIRNPARAARKALTENAEGQIGRRLTKGERKQAKKAAADILAARARRKVDGSTKVTELEEIAPLPESAP